jgi:hypothetical protein
MLALRCEFSLRVSAVVAARVPNCTSVYILTPSNIYRRRSRKRKAEADQQEVQEQEKQDAKNINEPQNTRCSSVYQ